MLSGLTVSERFRSLNTNSFTTGARFGARSVVYGHNGSGKSSLAELLLQLSEGRCEQAVGWVDETGSRTTISPGMKPPDVELSVFTKSWIRDNLHGFLDGETANGIVTLGSEAIGADEEQKKFERELGELKGQLPDANKDLVVKRDAAKAIVSSTQSSIVDVLRPVDQAYSKNRYNEPRVRELLRNSTDAYPEEPVHNQNILDVAKPAMSTIVETPLPVVDWNTLSSRVRDLLAHSVSSTLLAELIGNGELQEWVSKGLELHDGHENCLFCGAGITDTRWNELRQHFDDSRRVVQAQAIEVRSTIANERERFRAWRAAMPAEEDLYSSLWGKRTEVEKQQELVANEVTGFLDFLDALVVEKHKAPEKTRFGPLPTTPPTKRGADIGAVIRDHNAIVGRADQRRKELCDEIVSHLVGSRAVAYREQELAARLAQKSVTKITAEIDVRKRAIANIKSKRFSSRHMADKLNEDLVQVYGRHHLTIEVADEGKSYRCLRDGEPADNLSEGERNTLALLYFLRSLADQSVDVPKETRVVIVDDPSSSLDRESVFATHSWLLETLQNYGQSLIFTHDFEMLRLLLLSQKSQISNHRSAINGGGNPRQIATAEKEAVYPRVAFMEMYSQPDNTSQRTSTLAPISDVLLNYPSEYHYLFDRVMRGLANPGDHYALFLLPNAARRLLESFASFQVPERGNFEQQLRKLAVEDNNAAYRDVYDFCNRYSHGEGRETHEPLDARTVAFQLRRSMELLRTVDRKHFEAMCKATKHDPAFLDTEPASLVYGP